MDAAMKEKAELNLFTAALNALLDAGMLQRIIPDKLSLGKKLLQVLDQEKEFVTLIPFQLAKIKATVIVSFSKFGFELPLKGFERIHGIIKVTHFYNDFDGQPLEINTIIEDKADNITTILLGPMRGSIDPIATQLSWDAFDKGDLKKFVKSARPEPYHTLRKGPANDKL